MRVTRQGPEDYRIQLRGQIGVRPRGDRYIRAFDSFQGDNISAGMEQALAQLTSPWMRTFVRHDPSPILAKVTCPVLAINGELDLQVPVKQNLDAIAAALKKGGNPDWTVRAFPGLNHLFQHSETGLVSEYGQIEETISEEVLDFIADWIAVRFLGEARPVTRPLKAG